jgi:hypothetical protein
LVVANGVRVCPSCGNVFYAKRKNPSPFKGVKNEDRPNNIGETYRCD